MGKTEKIIFSDEQLKEMVRLHDEENLLNREIAEIFGVSKMTINRRLTEMGVKTRHPKLDLEREKWICDLYEQYKNKDKVCKIANVSNQTISELCKKYGLYEYTNSEVHKNIILIAIILTKLIQQTKHIALDYYSLMEQLRL